MVIAPLAVEPYGAAALVIWCAPDQTLGVAERARARWPQAREVVPGADSVVVEGIAEVEQAVIEVAQWSVLATSGEHDALVELPTIYDGPDLVEVARHWGVGPDEAVLIHTAPTYRVAFCGFAPGFAYCTGLPADREVPRRASPRPRVAAGSVALAGAFTGIYPTPSPGGWQIVGRTTAPLWDLGREEPALLVPGTRVRFVAR